MADHPQPDDVATGSDVLEVLAKAAFEAQHQPAVRTPLEAFLDQYRNDREEDAVRPLRKYLELFPGDERALAREYLALETALGEDSAAGLGRRSAESALSYGHYRVLKEIGRGGQGVVYLAEDSHLNRRVALKALTGLIPASEDTLRRFRREAEVASRLDHPGICAVYEAGIEDREPYIAMRYVEGETLARRITTARRSAADGTGSSILRLGTTAGTSADATGSEPGSGLSTSPTRAEVMLVIKLFEQAARALHVAHEAGVIHRDIKPGNIMVTPDGEPVILDFGLARDLEDAAQTLTKTGALFGTPSYMSPEQLLAHRVCLDRRTDVYSLGVSLHEALTLHRPFEAPTRQALYQAIQGEEPPDPRRLNRSISKDLKVVIATCLDKDRDRRYQTALDLAEELARVRRSEPIRARPASSISRLVRWCRRHPARATLAATLLIVVGLTSYLAASLDDIQDAREQRRDAAVELRLDTGFFELYHGDSSTAADAFMEAVKLNPKSGEAAGGLILTLLKIGKPEEALRACMKRARFLDEGSVLTRLRADALDDLRRESEAEEIRSQATPPTSALGFFLDGMRQIREGHALGEKSAEAREAFIRARDLFLRAVMASNAPRRVYHFQLAHAAGEMGKGGMPGPIADTLRLLWPKSAMAHAWRGFALIECDVEGAIAAYEDAIRLNPTLVSAHFNLGTLLYHRGDLEGAVAAFKATIRLNRGHARAHLNLGAALSGQGNLDAAINAYRAAITHAPDLAMAHANLGLALLSQGDLTGAIDAHMDAVRLDPTSAHSRFLLGKALDARGDFAEAVAAYSAAVRLDSKYSRAHEALGNALAAVGRLEDALAAHEEAVRLDPAFGPAHYNLGNSLAAVGRPEEAVAAYEKAIRLSPSFAPSHFNLGNVLSSLGRLDDAVVAYRDAIQVDPKHVPAHVNLATTLMDLGDLHGAVHAYECANTLEPMALTYFNLGVVLRARGDWDAAIKAYRDSIRLDPTMHSAYNNLGTMLRDQGDPDAAIAAHEEALRLNPNSAEAHCSLGHDLRESGRFKEALESMRRGHALSTERPGWSHRSREWVSDLERRVAHEEENRQRLDRLLRGETNGINARDRIELAEVAARAKLYSDAARLYSEAFQEAPMLVDAHGYRAALAALSAAGRGEETNSLDGTGVARWRKQALVWLNSMLDGLKDRLDRGRITEAKLVSITRRWKRGSGLASVRGKEALSRLDEDERGPWGAFWSAVDDVAAALQD